MSSGLQQNGQQVRTWYSVRRCRIAGAVIGDMSRNLSLTFFFFFFFFFFFLESISSQVEISMVILRDASAANISADITSSSVTVIMAMTGIVSSAYLTG